MSSITERCPDCDTPIVWTKYNDVREAYERAGQVTVLRWKSLRDYPVPAPVMAYRPHVCPRREEPHHA